MCLFVFETRILATTLNNWERAILRKKTAVNVLLRVFTKCPVPKGKVPLLNQQKKIGFIFYIYISLLFHLPQPAFSFSLSQVAFPFKARCFNELYCLWLKSFLRSARYLGFYPFLCLKYRAWMGTIWAISASLTRSSSRAQQGTRRALPWTGNSIFCTKKRGKELNYLHIHFP